MPTLALTGVAATGVSGTLTAPGLVALTLPVPRLAVAGQGAIPAVGLTLPAPVLAVTGAAGATGGVKLALPAPRLAIGGLNVAALTLPVPVLAVTGEVGLVGRVALTLPVPVLASAAPDAVRLQLPGWNNPPALAVTGTVGAVGSVVLGLPVAQLTMAGQVPVMAQAGLALPVPQLAVTGVAGNVAMLAATLGRLALAIRGHSGVVGQAALVLPVVQLAAGGYHPAIGAVELVLPVLQLRTGGRQLVTAGADPVTLVMHTEAMALTTYQHYPFNSFAAFRGVYLGASAEGIFALTGATDEGVLIDAYARVGISDFGTSFLKRVDRVYVGYRTDGDLVLRVYTDEVTRRDYRLAATGKAGLHGNHLRVGKGLVARYWQFEVLNNQGADFELNMVELKPVKLRRRVGGGDA